MAKVHFTSNLQQHLACPPTLASGRTVREILEAVFRENPRARSYVLDDQGGVRQHMIIFINGKAMLDRSNLTDEVTEDSEVYIMQALSGG